jgi:hypothetical protein
MALFDPRDRCPCGVSFFGFVWLANDRSGEAVYESARRILKQDVTREGHPEKFREAQAKLLFRAIIGGVLFAIGFRFFKKLGE